MGSLSSVSHELPLLWAYKIVSKSTVVRTRTSLIKEKANALVKEDRARRDTQIFNQKCLVNVNEFFA